MNPLPIANQLALKIFRGPQADLENYRTYLEDSAKAKVLKCPPLNFTTGKLFREYETHVLGRLNAFHVDCVVLGQVVRPVGNTAITLLRQSTFDLSNNLAHFIISRDLTIDNGGFAQASGVPAGDGRALFRRLQEKNYREMRRIST